MGLQLQWAGTTRTVRARRGEPTAFKLFQTWYELLAVRTMAVHSEYLEVIVTR